MSHVRVRFAPSPTGPLHIGGLRTALYNYLFAKQKGGVFVLRIEDTDQKRYIAGAEEYIQEALEWCGIAPDEGPKKGGDYGPYRQSERKETYREYMQKLIDSGNAYYAFDTPEELQELREHAEQQKQSFIYNYANREQLQNSVNLSPEEVQSKIAAGEDFVVRFKTQPNEELILQDEIRGTIRVKSELLDDKVLFKSDGMPTYHLANVVDDHLMQITHVIRGEEWLPSLALHYLLYRAFGWDTPVFVHLPLILKPEGKGKLSKRDGDKHGFPVFPLAWKTEKGTSMGYREEGYLPEAMINMLALLGWNPGTEQEIFSLDELIQNFAFQKVSKSGAKFDPKKTLWFNQNYIQRLSPNELATVYQKVLEERAIPWNESRDGAVAMQMQERVSFLWEIYEHGKFFYEKPNNFDSKSQRKAWKTDTETYVSEFLNRIQQQDEWSSEAAEKVLKSYLAEAEIGFGQLMMPLRFLLTGGLAGPDVFKIMEVLGKEEVIERLQNRSFLESV